ncbi:hypothetical protein [Sphingomonas lycopersici]|uniref:Uncharacterized protein n=1 Tax=Sphingomonas lycopersici TaxID=2951807 RepID=A0AA41ZBW6_9SPHN|nr:hypothetical protein [Sphingomonas lycopersici]MCW6533786.1 hypothetical protein [Sphingomonas lycopersici]
MVQLQFYREQAARQRAAADAATLQNVRERCLRAADTWASLAAKGEQANLQRIAVQKPEKTIEMLKGRFAPADISRDGV